MLLFTQCSPTLYVHNTLNTPLPSKKGDFKASYGTIGPYWNVGGSSVELQGSYAVSNRIAVMSNMLWMNWPREGGNFQGWHRLFEFGVGHYSTFWKNEEEPPLGRAEIMAGIGLGKGLDNLRPFESNIRYEYQGRYQRFFVQPAVGLRTFVVDVSLAFRTSYVRFPYYQQTELNGAVVERSSLNFATVEPAFYVSLGYKYAKIYTQTRLVQPLVNENAWSKVTDLDFAPFSMGIIFSSWPRKLKTQPALVMQKPSDASANEKLTESAPQVVLPFSQPTISICFRDAGSFDNDVIHLSFNGAYLLKDAVLTRKFTCLEVSPLPDTENVLRISGVSEGHTTPITIELIIRDGKKERVQYLRIGAGQTSEIRLLAPQ